MDCCHTPRSPPVQAAPEIPEYVRHQRLRQWVMEVASLTRPQRIVWCDGSQEEYDRLCEEMVAAARSSGSIPRSAPAASWPARTRPTSPASRTAPSSAALSKDDAGPTNNWMRPARDEGARCSACSTAACAAARCTSFPFSMGPLGSPIAHIGVRAHRFALRRRQHADHDPHGPRRCSTRSATAAASCPACTRSACRWQPGQKDVPWPCNQRAQVHRPLPRGARDLVLRQRLRRQRAAGQEVPRAAHRLGAWPATKAGWPSTC